MKEYSLLLLKPDCIQRSLTKIILAKVRATGLEIMATKILKLTKKDVETFYKSYQNDDYFNSLLRFMQSDPVVACIVRGKNAIKVLNELVGATEPSKAKAGTIRSMGIDACYNLVHSSSNKSDFFREVKVIFNEEELKKIKIQ